MLFSQGTLTASVVFGLSLSVMAHAGTPIYSYTDDSGTPNFTTELDSIPEKYRSRMVQLQLDSSPSPIPTAPAVPAVEPPPSGNVRTVNATGEYRMSDHDTRTDAVRLAVEAAKRDALEQVATYLESVTEVKQMEITRDEIRSYTAGIVTVLDQQITTRLEAPDTIVIQADLTAQVDPEEVARAITALRENESAKTQLAALRSDTDQLRQQLDAANAALAAAVSPEQVQALQQERQNLLNQMQSNALVSQAWTNWGYVTPVFYPYPWLTLQQVHGLLTQAQHIYPRSPHLPIAQQVITAQSGNVAPPPPEAMRPVQHPHPSLLVPPPVADRVTPPPSQALPGPPHEAPSASRFRPHTGVPSQPFSSPLPPTAQPVQPPRFHFPPPQVPHLVPHQGPAEGPRHGGNSIGHVGGHAGGSGHTGGGHHGR